MVGLTQLRPQNVIGQVMPIGWLFNLTDFSGNPQPFRANSKTEPHNSITATALHIPFKVIIH